MYVTDNTTPAISQSWYIPQLTNSTRTQNKTRLQMFHKIVNNKIEIQYENILAKSQSKTRYTQNQNKDSYTFSFFLQNVTIQDWNKLQENIRNNTTKMPLWDAPLSDTFQLNETHYFPISELTIARVPQGTIVFNTVCVVNIFFYLQFLDSLL